jgi:hypothetical protein
MTQANSENTTAMPGESAGTLYRRTDISPEDFFQALGRLRRAARDEIERLIDWLDTTIDCDQDAAVDDQPCDGDTDAEPSLGSFDRMSDQIKAWQVRPVTADVDCELDRVDSEPALGSPENHPQPPYTTVGYLGTHVVHGPAGVYRDSTGSQERWASGGTDDREGDPGCDDREPDVDAEPSEDKEPALGWNDEEAARGRYPSQMGRCSDDRRNH